MIDMRIEHYHITSDQRNFIVSIAKMDGKVQEAAQHD